jgi:uncharacterized membrane protein
VLLGLATGLRSFSAPAALVLRNRRLNGLGGAVLLAAAAELIADKLPATQSRLAYRALTARLLNSALTGWRVAGPTGITAGAAAALASAVAGHRLRQEHRSPLVAVTEDAIAAALATSGARQASRDSRPLGRYLSTVDQRR